MVFVPRYHKAKLPGVFTLGLRCVVVREPLLGRPYLMPVD
jgi:hypothetical protein